MSACGAWRPLRRRLVGASALALGLTLACGAVHPATAQEAAATYDIEGRTLAEALREFAQVSGAQIIFTEELVNGRPAPTLRGDYPPTEALEILLAGSGLRAERTPTGAIMIMRDGEEPPAPSPRDRRTGLVPTPMAPSSAGGARAAIESGASERIVVTGSRIRDGSPTAPVRIVGRDEIELSGFLGAGDLLQSLPENFGGGANPGNIGVPPEDDNVNNASTVNIRGLGDGATLVLLNGRRLPPNTSGQSPDIGGIPLQAVERIEVVKDGSSAIYGSDAVAGVVNFIMRADYDGGELSARVGGATRGGGLQQLYTALLGRSRPAWRGLVSAEYEDQAEISTRDREFTSTATDVPLSNDAERVSVFASVGGDLSDALSLELDALWSRRDTAYALQQRESSTRADIDVTSPSHLVSGGLGVELPADWAMRVNAFVSRSEQDVDTRTPARTSERTYENGGGGAEVVFDGALPIFFGPGAKAAFGVGARDEAFHYVDSVETIDLSHDVRSAFGELLAPLVDPTAARPGLHALDVSLSARYEDYSDFGSSTTPRIGVRYAPYPDIALRASWGESFKAPTFTQMALLKSAQILPASILGGSTGEVTILSNGGSLDLRPERSTSWTAGVDFERPNLASLVLGVSYFNIEYTDRVVSPISPVVTALSNPIFADYVVFDPTPEQQAAVIEAAGEFVFNATGAPYDPASVTTLVINNYTNAASQTAEGVDLSYGQSFDLPLGELRASANATFISMRRQTLATTPEFELSGIVHEVPEVRARGGLSWQAGDVVAAGFVNYQTGSIDSGAMPARDISSWTTVDATLSYDLPLDSSGLGGVNLTLSVQNLFDRAPPYAVSPAALHQGIFFDSVNASAVGRFVSVGLRTSF